MLFEDGVKERQYKKKISETNLASSSVQHLVQTMYRIPLARFPGSWFETKVDRTFERLKDILADVEQVRKREIGCRWRGMIHIWRDAKEQELVHMVRVVDRQNRVRSGLRILDCDRGGTSGTQLGKQPGSIARA